MAWVKGAVLAVSLSAAQAQAADCLRPIAPVLPDGAQASNAVMAETLTAMEQYQVLMNAYLECIDAEYADARSEGEAALARWNREVDAHRRAN